MAVGLGDQFAGPNNGNGCLTNRVVYLPSGLSPSDFIPVCRDGDLATPDGFDADGNPVCTPLPAGHVPPSWSQTSLPTGTLQMNPDPEALTGLESWFWYEGPTTHEWTSPVHEGRTADCQIIPAPAPVTYTVALTGYRYDIGDSRPSRMTASHPGTEEDPAARHTYRTKGEWEATVTCTWTGAPGSPLVAPCAGRTVPVATVRAVLTE